MIGTYARWNEDEGLTIGQDPPTTAEMTPVEAARIFRDNMDYMDRAAGIGDRDGIVGKPDLEAMRNDPNTPPELRQAIEYTLDNPAVFKSLDATSERGNRFNLEGVNNYIDQFEKSPGYTDGPMDDRRATEILGHYAPVLDTAANGGSSDNKFSEDDLRVFLSENPGAPPELRQAAEHLLGSQGLQDGLDNAAGRHWWNDDVYHTDDVNAYLGRR